MTRFLGLVLVVLVNAVLLLNGYACAMDVTERLHVVDELGMPVSTARVWGGLQTGMGLNDFTPVDGFTNSNGVYVVTGTVNGMISLRVYKSGYYSTETCSSCSDNQGRAARSADGPVDKKVILKSIKNPVHMEGTTRRKDFKVPRYDEWLGFDLELCDFVSPVGAGKVQDVLIRFSLQDKALNDYHMRMDVSFTNNVSAGVYEKKMDSYSELRSAYVANTNEVYVSTISYHYDRSPRQPVAEKILGKGEYLVFRVRTKVDADGRLISAHYGKIYGPWNFVGPGGMQLPFVKFNQVPNDVNLEDSDTSDYSKRRTTSFNLRHPTTGAEDGQQQR